MNAQVVVNIRPSEPLALPCPLELNEDEACLWFATVVALALFEP